MRRLLMTIGIAVIGLLLVPAAGIAAGNAQTGATVGNCISDGLYGNEPNIVDPEVEDAGPAELEPGTGAGRVVPSQSPGPKKTEPDGSVVPGSSVGDFHQKFGGGTVPQVCRESI
jgi:hypothetical protein